MFSSNKGNPNHDEKGRFTSGPNKAGGNDIDGIKKTFDNFFSSLEKQGLKLNHEKKPGSSKLEEAIDEEIADYKRIQENFGWHDSHQQMAEYIAYVLEKRFGPIKGLEEKILAKLDGDDEIEDSPEVEPSFSEKMQKTMGISKPQEDKKFDIDKKLEITNEDGDVITTIDVTAADYVDYLKSRGIKLNEQQLEDLEYEDVLPEEFFDEDSMDDFKEFIQSRKKDEIDEQAEDEEYDRWYKEVLGRHR